MEHILLGSALAGLVRYVAGQDGENIVMSEFGAIRIDDPSAVYNTSFPPFPNAGGPPDLSGALYQDTSGYIGMIDESGFTSSQPLGNGQYMLQMGRYISWECTGIPGEYRATVLRRDLYSNGTIEVASRCEKGKIVAPNVYYWLSSTVECPSIDEPFPEWSKTTIDTNGYTSLPPPAFGNLTCGVGSGPDNPSGMDTSGSSGLDPAYADALGVYQIVSPSVIPPTYNVTSSGVDPPSFANPGITPVVNGIWDIENLDAFRTISGNGFAIVSFNNTSREFSQVLGRYESYECTPFGYRSVATQSSFNQTGPVYFQAAGGCSSADLGSIDQGLVRITATVDTTCPAPDDGSNGRLQVRIFQAPSSLDSISGDLSSGPLCLNKAASSVGSVAVALAVVSLLLSLV
jgi:hypothetical protein